MSPPPTVKNGDASLAAAESNTGSINVKDLPIVADPRQGGSPLAGKLGMFGKP